MPKVTDRNHPVMQLRKAISKEFKLSQDALASLVGCSRSSIQYIENGRLKLSAEMARRIDEVLGSALFEWLKGGADEATFKLDEKELVLSFEKMILERYKTSIDHENILPSGFDMRHEIFQEKGWDMHYNRTDANFSDIVKAFKVASDKAIESFGQELMERGFDAETAAKYSSHFFDFVSVKSFDQNELQIVHELMRAALEHGKHVNVSWCLIEWADKMKARYGLKLRNFATPLDEVKSSRNFADMHIDEVSDDTLEALGWRRVFQTGVYPPESENAGMTWEKIVIEEIDKG